MTRCLVTIPAVEPLVFSQRCLESLYSALVRTSTLLVIVYNGPDDSVISDFSDNYVAKIGFEDSRRLATTCACIADCSEELLFGRQEYGRSYGGASNLLLVLGCALGVPFLRKIDDDCIHPGSTATLFPQASVSHAGQNEVYWGHYVGEPSGFLHQLDDETAFQLARHVYGRESPAAGGRIGFGLDGKTIKNGNLIIPRAAAMAASYPVLYHRETGTHARGEVHYWRVGLSKRHFAFRYDASLELGHSSAHRNSLRTWLCALTLALDLSHVHRISLRERRHASLAERKTAVAACRSWVIRTRWPDDVDVDELVSLLDSSIAFTERFYADVPRRREAWNRLMKADLERVVEHVLPCLEHKANNARFRRGG